jgi:hypothetical protein
MIILKQQATTQEIKFIPRSTVANTVILRNEITNEVTTFKTADLVYNFQTRVLADGGTFENIETLITTFGFVDAFFSEQDYYLKTSLIFALKEFTYYNLTILNDLDVIYKGRVFCTNQTISEYTVNKNEYVQNVTNNEFVEYE